MTQLVKDIPQPQGIVTLSNHAVSTELYYGVQVHNGVDGRGFIQTIGYDNNSYHIVCLHGFTRCNGWSSILAGKSTLRSCIDKLLTENECQVYVFNTARELFAWLLGDDQPAKSSKRK